MSVKIIGTTSGVEVDSDTDHNLYVQVRPPATGTLGAYVLGASTGLIAATLAAGSTLFSFRWTDATRFALITSIRISAVVTAAITTGVVFDLEAVIARSFTASDTGGTAFAPLGANNKVRTSMGNSLVGDLRLATTAALGAGTRTPDATAVGRIQGFTGTTLGTSIFGNGSGPMYILDRQKAGEYPVVLAQNEGILVRNPLIGPATGSFSVAVLIEWMEVAAY